MTSYHEKLFLGRSGQICSIAKEDPLGIVQVVQPEGSYFGDGTKMCPLSQEIMTPYHKKLQPFFELKVPERQS